MEQEETLASQNQDNRSVKAEELESVMNLRTMHTHHHKSQQRARLAYTMEEYNL